MTFDYIPRSVAGEGCSKEDVEVTFEGCDCIDSCSLQSACSCLIYNTENYDEHGRLINTTGPILECHPNCACSFGENPCGNRVVGRGIQVKLEKIFLLFLIFSISVFSSPGKGSCVRTMEKIPSGTFIAEYAGEIVGKEEVEKRAESGRERGEEHNYTLTVREHFGDRTQTTFIDPRLRGNLSRFFNHSCEPNMDIVIVRIGQTVPVVGLFAARDISPLEELCYDYGVSLLPSSVYSKKCLCGTPSCRGTLPASATATSE